MFDFFKRLSPKATAEELRASLASIDVEALEAALAATEKERAHQLLHGDNSAVLVAEEKVQSARIDLDRARAMSEALGIRISEAEAAERKAIRKAEIDEAEAKVKAVTKLIGTKAADAARIIDAALADVADAERARTEAVRNQIRDVGSHIELHEMLPHAPSVGEWLSGAKAEALPRWYRHLIYEEVRKHEYL